MQVSRGQEVHHRKDTDEGILQRSGQVADLNGDQAYVIFKETFLSECGAWQVIFPRQEEWVNASELYDPHGR